MLDNKAELKEFKKKLADNGFTISALSCHGNPLHPDQDRAKRDQEISRKTIRLAEKLGVPGGHRFQRLPRRFAERRSSRTG